jgi:ATP-dependent Lhr-like helicase
MASEATSMMTRLDTAPTSECAFRLLPHLLRSWFEGRFGQPTAAQRFAWPAVDAGKNLLLAAPTGTGKTLAAFLPIVGKLLDHPTPGQLRCLYVSPLKALVNDVRRTLRRHLRELRHLMPENMQLPRVGHRTGDTSDRLRRRLMHAPPEVLLTTPESLAVMMSVPAACRLLQDVRWVVVDEVHALASSKRGADLSLALERLQSLCRQPLQRIGLSATSAPAEEAARFLVGANRCCSVAEVPDTPRLKLLIEPLEEDAGFMAQLVQRLGQELTANRSTLIFTNTRSLAELLGWALRRRYPAWDAEIAVHHSSLAAARRRAVERQFQQGRLRAVVSSTSLELGIDIGTVDGVVLIHPPGCVVRLLQRVGRSGHEPHAVRRGLVLTNGIAELLEATVTCASASPARFEPLLALDAPLDVLCQHLLGLAAMGCWSADEAFQLVRRAHPYRHLSRKDLEDCLRYLDGRRDEDVPWLPSRLQWQGERFSILDRRTARILRRNIGTIVSEEPRRVLLRSTDGEFGREMEVGNVDEPYADRLQPGDRFLLDGRCLECRQPGPGDLLVEEVPGRPAVPRWQSDVPLLAGELARRLYLLRVQSAEALRQGPHSLLNLLRHDYGLQDAAALVLADFFQQQEQSSEIPDQRTCLIECVCEDGGTTHYIHTPLAHAANDSLARVAVLRLARDLGRSVTSIVADLGFAILCRRALPLTPDEWRTLLAADGFEADLDESLKESISLRERFRRVAMVGLMVLRNPLGAKRRVGGHDWAERRLFDKVRAAEPEFVLLRQARKEMQSACDFPAAQCYLELLPRLEIKLRRLDCVSPFAACWTQQLAGPIGQLDGPAQTLKNLHSAIFGGTAQAV